MLAETLASRLATGIGEEQADQRDEAGDLQCAREKRWIDSTALRLPFDRVVSDDPHGPWRWRRRRASSRRRAA